MPPKPLTSPLKPIYVAGLALLLAICLVAFAVGIVGMRILLDEDGSSSLSRSVFGQSYRRLIAINPFFSAMFFNGGMIGSMFSVTKLLEHARVSKRAKQSPPAAAPGSAAAAAEESQKTKKDK